MKGLRALITAVLLSSIVPVAAMPSLIVSECSSQEATQKQEPPAKAVVKYKPEPHCPKMARKRKIDATIVLRAIFRASGTVTDIKFDKVIPGGLPDEIVKAFTEESIKVASKIKFEPAMKTGHPVSMYMLLEYNFHCY
jgi:hypothetical protein